MIYLLLEFNLKRKDLFFILKEDFILVRARFPGGLKELMQFSSVQLTSREQCVHVRVWLQDICSHPKTNLAQLKMSARERIQSVVRPRN